MEKISNYILMYKNEEVLSFEVTFAKQNKVKITNRLEHFDKAPFGIKTDATNEENNDVLFKFFLSRCIPSFRWDYQEIIDNTGYQDGFALSFAGHGLSLANHYWYRLENENLKYEDINFFSNKWDDSFARAVLKGDYKALKDVNLNVPDIVTSGWAVKGWLSTNEGPKLYKLSIKKDHIEESLGEVLASRLARRLFNSDEVIKYDLEKIYDKYASVSKSMLNVDEELVPLSNILPRDLYSIYLSKNNDKKYSKEFFKKLLELGMPDLYQFFVKLMCLRSLCFLSDLHFENISMIRNLTTGKMRIAPMYDLAGAFGSSERGRQLLSNLNKGTYFLIYFIFSNLEPGWDYSWYKSSSLDGFEDEIKSVLSMSDFYSEELIENILEVYRHQKATLDELAK